VALLPSDRKFLAALRDGDSMAAYAREHGYTLHWAKWKSRSVRRRLGVDTIGEAIAAMADEDGVSRGEFEKLMGLVGKLGDSVDELARRPDSQAARQQVAERQVSLKDHAAALGLTLEDVEKLKGEQEYERFKAMQQRLSEETALEDDADDEGEGEDEGDGKGSVRTFVDGLGGIRNVKP
jgi:hypothetical protein